MIHAGLLPFSFFLSIFTHFHSRTQNFNKKTFVPCQQQVQIRQLNTKMNNDFYFLVINDSYQIKKTIEEIKPHSDKAAVVKQQDVGVINVLIPLSYCHLHK